MQLGKLAGLEKQKIEDELQEKYDFIKECEEILNLCESDNVGIRYTLIGLYCTLEKFEECEKLYKKFKEYSAFMFFPMAIMYFKKGDYKKSKKFLKDVQEANPYIIKILKLFLLKKLNTTI